MTDYTKSNIGSGYNAATNINTELGKIETAIASKVDEEGGVMTGDLQMNSNDVLNVGQLSTSTLILGGNSITSSSPVASSVTVSSTRTVATASQTAFTVPEYAIGVNAIAVYLNGVKLTKTTDYTETDTTTITLTSAASLDDVLEFIIGATVTDANVYDSSLVSYDDGTRDVTTVQAILREFQIIGSASAAPTTGTYVVGDKFFNTSPSAGGTIGWVCVAGGSPGTWKTFGTIAV